MASRHSHSKPEESELRIVLFGKTGVGKSASGNTILGSDSFDTNLSSASETGICKKGTREFDGQTLAIIDTPGLFHSHKTREEVTKEILTCITWITPGPHVFLLVLKLGDFSRQDKKVLEDFQRVFKHATDYTVVLFTHGDQCNAEDFIEKNKSLKKFMSGRRYHVFNNEVQDESQVKDLLQTIKTTVQRNKDRNKSSFYSNKMFKLAVKAFEALTRCPEVNLDKDSKDPKKAGEISLADLICDGLELMQAKVPGLRGFLKKVQDVALQLMPSE